MKLSEKRTGEFTPHPETDAPVRAVIVDITPLKKRQTEYGEKEEFRLVFETEVTGDDGKRLCIWSRGYNPSLNEKANLRKDLKKLLGRDLTAQELEEFDTEGLLGLGAKIMVEHGHSKDGTQTYANIAMMRPDPTALKPSGNYIRVQDREQKGGGNGAGGGETSSYRKAPTEEGRLEWQKVKVHVGKHAGVDLGDLEADAVQALIDKWLPAFAAMPKPLKADRDLAAALEEVKALLSGEPAPAEETQADY